MTPGIVRSPAGAGKQIGVVVRRQGIVPLVVVAVTAGALVSAAPVRDAARVGADARLVASTATVTASTQLAPCADVLLLGARGSAEGTAGTSPSPGVTVRNFRDTYVAAATAAGRTVEQRYVDLDAPSVKTLHLLGHPARPASSQVTAKTVRTWSRGVSDGVDHAVATLTSAATACPDQVLVLAGYAQGAMVLHRTLLRLHSRIDITRRIVGVALVGDGDRRAGSLAPHTTGAPAASVDGSGVQQRYLNAYGDVPAPDRPVAVWNICSRGDLACDIRGNRLDAAVAVHRSYRSGTAADRVRSAARAIWARTADVPVPTPRVLALDARVAQPLVQQLTATVDRSGAQDLLRWSALTTRPPGVKLSGSGMLSGVPTTVGTWTVYYVVSNPRDPAYPTNGRGSVTVTVAPAAATAVSAGGGQSCSTLADGTAKCWGANSYGELGDGTTTQRLTPTNLPSTAGWRQVTTGGSTTCGIQNDGSAWCWGLNHRGQVGDGTRTRRLAPVRVGTAMNWSQISTGWWHTCGVRTDGTAWCWGDNANGELGDGTTTRRLTPVRVAGGGEWTSVVTGGWHSCGLRTDGTAWCWGSNTFGQLGDGTSTRRLTPVRVGTANDWRVLTSSWLSTCGIEEGGALSCWGGNDRGQLGDGTVANHYSPTSIAAGTAFADVSTGEAHTCAVTTVGTLWCWGDNAYGQLGDGTTTARTRPGQVGTDSDWARVSASWFHSCAVRTGGDTWCWGDNQTGKLGDGTTTTATAPVAVATP
ncbi:MAG: RCC1 domain-containing protein [Nocardioides sp.]